MGLFSLERLRSINPLGPSVLPVAVDFGSQSLKALQLSALDQPSLVAAAALPVPEALAGDPTKRLAWQIEQLPRLLKSAPFRARRAVCSIPSAQLFCKHVQAQIDNPDDAGPIVTSLIAVQLRCDPAVVAARHVIVDDAVPPAAGKNEVIVMAASRALVQRLMDALKACKLEPVGIHPEPLALLRSFAPLNTRPGEEAVTNLYLDLGAGSTKVVIGHGPHMVFCKIIQLGGRHLDQTVARQAACTLGEAHSVRLGLTNFARPTMVGMAPAGAGAPSRGLTGIPALDAQLSAQGAGEPGAAPEGQAGADEPARPAVDLSEPLDTLTDEISACLRYYESLFPRRRVGRTIFVGGEAKHVGLCQHVARKLRLPAHAADPLARVARPPGGAGTSGVDFAQVQPGWAVCAGLSLTPCDL